MIAYSAGSSLTNQHGLKESILFVSSNGVLLSGDGEHTKEHLVTRETFHKALDAQSYIIRQAQHPHLALTDYQQSTITARLVYLSLLKELVAEGKPATTRETYDELIKRVEQAHPATIATKHPCWKTICRHWRTWVCADFNNESLASKKRHCVTRLNSASEAFIQHHVSTVYSCSNSQYKRAFYADYVRQAKAARLSNPEIYPASSRTYYRRLKAITDEEKLVNFEGLSNAERNKRLTTLRKRIKTYYAMQRVECDRVTLNMCLIDDVTGNPTPPISLYVAIDVYSRVPIAVVLSFEAENSAGGLNLLRQMFMSDNNLPMHGRKPTTLIMDNGPGFNNALIKKAAERLELDIHYAPSNQPAKKPFIESFFNTLRNDFFSGMKIETHTGEFSIGFQSYSPKRTSPNAVDTIPLNKRANVTVSDFIKLLNIYLSEYTHKLHRSAGLIPIDAWHQSLIDTPTPSYSYTQLQHCFHVSTDKASHKLQSRGVVRCLGQDFHSDELKALYKATKKDMAIGENPSVRVFYDAHDARKVTVVTTLPGQQTPVEYLAYNIDLQDTEQPVSFYELNKSAPPQFGIYQHHYTHSLTGEYVGCIDAFAKQKPPRARRRGPAAPSFNKNTKAKLTVQERITKSNDLTISKSPIPPLAQQGAYDDSMMNKINTVTPTRLDKDEGNKKLW